MNNTIDNQVTTPAIMGPAPTTGSDIYLIALYALLPLAIAITGIMSYCIQHLRRSTCCGASTIMDLARSNGDVKSPV